MRSRYNVSLREGDLGAGGLELGRHALAALAVRSQNATLGLRQRNA